LSEELIIRGIAAKFVPRLLQNEQKGIAWKSAGNCNNSFKRIQTFYRRFSLVTKFGFMATVLKLSSSLRSRPFSPWPKEARKVKSNIMFMLIGPSAIDGIVHKEFVSPVQTVDKEFYRKFLRPLMEGTRRKRPGNWPRND
jgi:hypothetical protein